MPASTPTLLTAKDKAPDANGSYFLSTPGTESKITIRYAGLDYTSSMVVNAYAYDSGWEKRSSELVAVAASEESGSVVFTAAWKQTSTYGSGTSASSNVSWSFTELKPSGNGTQLTDALINSGTKSAPFEALFGTSPAADLNNDGVVGPKNLTKSTTDTAGVTLARDAEGTVYIQDSVGGATKNIFIRDGLNQNSYMVEQPDYTWGDSNNGGGSNNKIFAVGKGSPKAWALTQSSQVAAAFDSVTTNLDFNNNDNGYWALRKNEYWNTNNGVKTTSTANWSLLKIGSDGNLLGTSNSVPVAWLEGYFGQELNGDGVQGPDLKWSTKGGGGTSANPSGLQIAKDADGAAFLVKSYTNKTDLQDLSDNGVLMIKTANGDAIKASLSAMGQDSYGSEVTKLVSVTESGSENQYLYVRSYRVTNAGTSNEKTSNINWQVYKLALGKDSNGNITSVTANWDKWLEKIGAEETTKGIDIDGNGEIGVGTPTTLPNATDTVNEVLGVDSEGSYYIIRSGSTPLLITNGKSMFEDSTWQTKAPVAIVKATPDNVITGWTAGNYYALTKTVYNQGGKPQYQIDEIDANGEWKSTKQWINNNDRLSKFEEVFNQDLNGDGQKTTTANPIVPTAISTDNWDATKSKYNNGVAVAKDGDGRVYVVTATYTNGTGTPALTDLKPVVYMGGSIPDLENGSSNSTERNERKIMAAEKVDNKDEYLLAVKNTKTILATNKVEVTWDISILKTATAFASSTNTGTGYVGTGYAGTGTGSYYATMNTGSDLANALYITETTNTATIAGREREFGQDLNGDGKIGIDLGNLTKLSTDKYGVRLAKDSNTGLYITQVKNNVETAVALSGGMMGQLESTSNWETRTAVAAEAKRNASGDIEFYRVAVLRKSNVNTMGYAMPGSSTPTTTDTSTWQQTWDILQFDTSGKMVYGSMDNGQWKDVNVYNQKSIADFEEFFNEDLNNDGKVGVNAAGLTMALLDTQGARLARNAKDNSIYIVEGVGEAAKAKSIRTNGGDLEYKNTWGTAGSYSGGNSREAVAVEAVKDSAGTVTGYRLAMKEKYTNWEGKDNVTWSILKLDAKGAVTYGQWDAAKGYYVDESLYGLKSISSYEEDWFKDDLNGDGRIGVDAASLKLIETDTFGAKLARDGEKSLYIVEGKSVKSVDSSWLEYENAWGSGSNKKEAVAVEAVRDASGAITAYKLALKQTDIYDGKETIRWEVMTLGSDGKMSKNGAMAMASGGSSTYSNSIAPYESLFGQDLNGDGRVGVDVSTLTKGTTDRVGVTFARDTENALYLIKADGTPVPIGNSSWLEYDNTWGSGYNKSEIYAIEAMGTGGYKVIVKRSNAWYASAEDKSKAEVTVTWDLMQLDPQGQVTYGYNGTNGMWVNTSLWGLKSLAPYEQEFGQDFNGDGVTGVDFNALKNYSVSTDTSGVRLYRDKDKALYIVNDPANPTSIKAIGNASYLEYDYSWSTNSNKVEAYAVEAVTVNNAITGYKLVLKQTNVNNGQTDLNWQILRLDVDGTVNWGMSPTGGGNIWTKKISQVETAIAQDTPEDDDTIIGIDASQLVSASPANSGDATDSIELVKSSDGSIFIKDSRSGSKLVALADANGNVPNLEYSYTMGGSTSQAKLMGVAANGSDYRIALKTTGGTTTNWQFYNISAEGVLDWTKVINTRSASKYESAFQQEFDGTTGFGLQVTLKALDTDPVITGSTDAFLKIDEATSTVYIADGNATVAIADPNGGVPNFNYSRTGFESKAYAVHKLANNGGYVLAVEKTTTDWAGESINWEVYKLSAATNGEATVNWSQTKYLTNLADVEEMLQKDTIADTDAVAGYPEETATVLSADTGTYRAALTTTGALHLFKYDSNGVRQQDISVLDESGLAVRLEKSSTWDSASSFTAKVVGAEAIFGSGNTTTPIGYKVVLEETTIIDGGKPDQLWKIYSVGLGASSTDAKTTAVLSPDPIVSHSMVTWEDTFQQDLNGDGNDKGMETLVTEGVSTDSEDLALDDSGAIYVSLGDDWIPVLNQDLGAESFEDSESFANSQINNYVVAAEWSTDTLMLILEQEDFYAGDEVDSSWAIHFANYDTNTKEAILDETKTVYTDDPSVIQTLFQQNVSSPVL